MQVDLMLSNDTSERRPVSLFSREGQVNDSEAQQAEAGQGAGAESKRPRLHQLPGMPLSPLRAQEQGAGDHGASAGYSTVVAPPGAAGGSNMVFPLKKAKDGASSLRTFGQSVCRQLEKSRVTTYNDVANQLVEEYRQSSDAAPTREAQSADEKNIRRRTYDALNVLAALDIVERKNKTLRWVGLPDSCNALKPTADDGAAGSEEERLLSRIRAKRIEIERKKNTVEVLAGHYRNRELLVMRHEVIPDVPADRRVSLPFVLAGVAEGAEVDLTMSEDKQEAQMTSTHQFALQDDRDALALLERNGRLKRTVVGQGDGGQKGRGGKRRQARRAQEAKVVEEESGEGGAEAVVETERRQKKGRTEKEQDGAVQGASAAQSMDTESDARGVAEGDTAMDDARATTPSNAADGESTGIENGESTGIEKGESTPEVGDRAGESGVKADAEEKTGGEARGEKKTDGCAAKRVVRRTEMQQQNVRVHGDTGSPVSQQASTKGSGAREEREADPDAETEEEEGSAEELRVEEADREEGGGSARGQEKEDEGGCARSVEADVPRPRDKGEEGV